MTIQDFAERYLPNLPEAIPFKTSVKKMKKGTVLTSVGDFEKCVYFIQSGIIITSIPYKEEERILDFHFEGSFCSSYSAWLTNQPSDISLTCYVDCVLEVVALAELKQSYKTSLYANQLGRVATEMLYVDRVKREKELLTKTAKERYQTLLEKNPKVVQEMPVKELSKYLGIRPESLSRIRNT